MPTKYRVNAQKALHFYPFSAHLPTTTTNAVFRAQQQSPAFTVALLLRAPEKELSTWDVETNVDVEQINQSKATKESHPLQDC